MAKKALADIPYLLDRGGRYFARVVIPKKLRPFLDNKSELREPLGPDRRAAKEALNEAVGRLKATLRQAARAAEAAGAGPVSIPANAQTPEKIMVAHYRRMIALDNEFRNTDHRFARFGYADEQVVEALRQGMAGAVTDGELMDVIGDRFWRLCG
ncbi:DUF6538 domain-containing protein [Rhizobium sp. FKL33]|uniref:DUF6538 domain-containing protein n=1 Tax=Rhizobium sp. FKL33 TaxID=2562307 RepID=UPI0010BF909D|nr:DUF6538 domain-containing protein [Rhizobium sp. FKL33]